MRMPRLLPLVAVAAGGVLAINAIENGPGIVGAARSFAEGVAPKSAAPAAQSALPPDVGAVSATSTVVAAKPAPVCAESPTELAKAAGLSPAELQVIQSLGARRGELDQREQGLSTELALIQAAEAKVDARIVTMNGLKGDMQALLGQLDDKQQAELARLVKVYEDMKPQLAAARFTLLTDEVRLPIAAQMKEQKLSAIIANMAPPDAKHLTEALAARYVAQAAAARAAINPQAAPPAPAPAKPPAPIAPPAPTQAAAPDQATQAAAAPVQPKPVVHRKPKVAKPPAKTLAAAKPPEPVWPPKPAAGAAAPPAGAKSAAASAAPAKSAAAAPAPKPAAAPASPPAAKSASSAPAAASPAGGAPAKTG
jgi:flagellar motility protein MotE (MotC chaperone)